MICGKEFEAIVWVQILFLLLPIWQRSKTPHEIFNVNDLTLKIDCWSQWMISDYLKWRRKKNNINFFSFLWSFCRSRRLAVLCVVWLPTTHTHTHTMLMFPYFQYRYHKFLHQRISPEMKALSVGYCHYYNLVSNQITNQLTSKQTERHQTPPLLALSEHLFFHWNTVLSVTCMTDREA